MSSIVLITDILSSTERFLIKIRRRSLGDGCGGGTITVGIDFVKESSEFDKCEREFFSDIFKLLSIRASRNY